MLRFVEKITNLQPVLSENIHSMVHTLILAVSWHLNINLPQHTRVYIGVLLFFLIFLNLILRLKHSKRHFTKMLTERNLLTKVYRSFLITHLLEGLLLLQFLS